MLARWAPALGLASLLAACSTSEKIVDPPPECTEKKPLQLSWQHPAELAIGSQESTAKLVLSDELNTSELLGHIELTGEGTLGILSGGPLEYQLELKDLKPGNYRLTISKDKDGQSLSAKKPCLEVAESASAEFVVQVEAWRHTEAIVTGAAKPISGPYFNDLSESSSVSAQNLGAGRGMIVDFDGDGKDDIVTLPTDADPMSPRFLKNVSEPGKVFFEDFTDRSGMAGEEAAIMVFADLDNDGDQDAFTGLSFRADNGKLGFWENDGSGKYTYKGAGGVESISLGRGLYKEMAAAGFADFDGDGILDLYIGMWYGGSTRGSTAPIDDELYKGVGNFTFQKVELPDQTNPLTAQEHPNYAEAARAAYGLSIGDYDNDGDMDVFVNNYGAGRPAAGSAPKYWEHNLLWRNNGQMNFENVAEQAGVHATQRGIGGVQAEARLSFQGKFWPKPIGGNGFGCQFADFDNDQDLDLIVGTIAHPDYAQSDRTMLHVNQGGGEWKFTEESSQRGLEYYEDELHPALIDIDNDGLLDLAMSRLRGGSKWELYLQNASHNFEMKTYADSGVDITRPGPSVWFDVDGDGDLDFFMPKGRSFLFENASGSNNNYLKIDLLGKTIKDATGARVTLETSAGTQMREVTSGNGHYNTQFSRTNFFGLGQDSGAKNLRIRWPDGSTQNIGDVKANYHLHIEQDGAITVLNQ